MPHTLGPIVPKILAMGLISLREKCVLPRLVNASYSSEAAIFRATVDVPIPTKQVAADITPSNTAPAPTNNNMTTAQIVLNKWKKSDFYLADKDLREIDKNQSFVPMQMTEAVRALANQVNADIHGEYKEIYVFSGAPGTTPFGTSWTGRTRARFSTSRFAPCKTAAACSISTPRPTRSHCPRSVTSSRPAT